jgi:GH25 family lysozyme M1 (1,4-beta-N-acetylmuramidase)
MKTFAVRSVIASLLTLFGVTISIFASKPLGTDVSSYQPTVDWLKCKTNGIAFAYTKATEGTGYTDSTMVSHINGAVAQGIPIGMYHYARPDLHTNITGASSADSEAQHFLDVAGPYIQTGGKYLIPMLDWEAPGITNTTLSQPASSQWVNEWCYYVSNYAKTKGITMKCMVYSGTWYCAPGSPYNGGLNSTVTQWPNAMSGYPKTPDPQTGAPSTSPWTTFTVWQYADTNWSGGDSDVFNGTTNQMLQTLLIGGNGAPLITNDVDSVTANLGDTVTFGVGVQGNAPFTYRWYSNSVNVLTSTTDATFTVTNVQLANAGNYYVTVSNSLGITTSAIGYLSLLPPLTNAPNSNLIPTNFVDFYPAEANCNDVFGSYPYTPHGNFTYGNGKIGLGWKFNGSNTYLTNAAPSMAVPWTFSLWVNRQNAPGTSAGLVSDGTYSLKLEQYNATRQVGLTKFGVGDYNFGYSAPANTWVHLTFVGTSTGTKLYANGVQVGSLTNSIPLPRQYLGADYLTSTSGILDYTTATVDEVLVFNRALSTTEISTLYNAGTGGLVRAPEVTSIVPGTSTVTLNIRGVTGKTFTIYRSPDLINWTSLGRYSSPVATPGQLQFFDTMSAEQFNYKLTQP